MWYDVLRRLIETLSLDMTHTHTKLYNPCLEDEVNRGKTKSTGETIGQTSSIHLEHVGKRTIIRVIPATFSIFHKLTRSLHSTTTFSPPRVGGRGRQPFYVSSIFVCSSQGLMLKILNPVLPLSQEMASDQQLDVCRAKESLVGVFRGDSSMARSPMGPLLQ